MARRSSKVFQWRLEDSFGRDSTNCSLDEVGDVFGGAGAKLAPAD